MDDERKEKVRRHLEYLKHRLYEETPEWLNMLAEILTRLDEERLARISLAEKVHGPVLQMIESLDERVKLLEHRV